MEFQAILVIGFRFSNIANRPNKNTVIKKLMATCSFYREIVLSVCLRIRRDTAKCVVSSFSCIQDHERCIYRGTQRICSSHYLFPRGILLAGKNSGVSMSWLGNFVIDRGFPWELLTFSSISTRAGRRNSED